MAALVLILSYLKPFLLNNRYGHSTPITMMTLHHVLVLLSRLGQILKILLVKHQLAPPRSLASHSSRVLFSSLVLIASPSTSCCLCSSYSVTINYPVTTENKRGQLVRHSTIPAK